MFVTIEKVSEVEDGIWRTELNSREIEAFGTCTTSFGDINVILIDGVIDFDRGESYLLFDLNSAHILNIGQGDNTIILRGIGVTEEKVEVDNLARGDIEFFENLTSDSKQLARDILHGVRRVFEGELKYYKKFEIFVETPDNFWAIKALPDGGLKVIVKGQPGTFRADVTSISLASEWTNYSSFVINNPRQVLDAVQVIKEAGGFGEDSGFDFSR